MIVAQGCSDAAAPRPSSLVSTTAGPTASLSLTTTVPANECATPGTGWIFCDDFETDRTAQYYAYDNSGGKFVRTPATGFGGSVGMRATYTTGATSAGQLSLAFGRTPSAAYRAVDQGVANYREIYLAVLHAPRDRLGWERARVPRQRRDPRRREWRTGDDGGHEHRTPPTPGIWPSTRSQGSTPTVP